MGGRGAGSGLKTATPTGEGVMDPNPNYGTGPDLLQANSLKEALGSKGRAMSIEKAALGANPYYDTTQTYAAFNLNCQRAVQAYEARRRGYNVTAKPTYENDTLGYAAYVNPRTGVRNSFWMGGFKGAKPVAIGKRTPKATQQALEKQMAKFGNGSRAILQVQWKGRKAGGHVLIVERVRGKNVFIDPQIGKKYRPNELFNVIKTTQTQVVRVDNLRISERMKNAVEPAGIRTGGK